MKKSSFLKSVAQTGYNVGFGAKKHFVTYDFHRVLPKLISFIVLFIGVFQLTDVFKKHVSGEYSDVLSILLILLALIALSIDFLTKDLSKYNTAGKELLSMFNEMRETYNRIKDTPDDYDCSSDVLRLRQIEKHFSEISISEQAIFTHIITNLRFFSEMQTDWIDEQLHFKITDKFPFYHPEAFVIYLLLIVSCLFIIKNAFC